MAVCSYHPYIQIFKPILLLALEDYFINPSIDCLAQLFHAINTMDTTGLPQLSHHERLILRCTERQDMFEEKFIPNQTFRDSCDISNSTKFSSNHSNLSLLSTSPIPQTNNSIKSIIDSNSSSTPLLPSSASINSLDNKLHLNHHHHHHHHQNSHHSSSGSISSFSPQNSPDKLAFNQTRSRASSNLINLSDSNHNSQIIPFTTSWPSHKRPRDTHFFDTKIIYAGKSIPVRIPLQTFPEEVGEYSLIQLIQTFSSPNALSQNGPFHPHLHSNGPFTHPIILLFNALVTQKRIIFLGHGLPAGIVSQMVLAACALGSGCGGILEGFTARAFPYSNLTTFEEFKAVPGFIAGVTNPIFELHTDAWDVFCNIETGKITISKEIAIPSHLTRPFSPIPPERSMTEISTPSGGIIGGLSVNTKNSIGVDEILKTSNNSTTTSNLKVEMTKDLSENALMEDLLNAIQAHFGEAIIRARFMDYVRRFVKIASMWEEEQLGSSSIGIKTKSFKAPINYLNVNTLEEKIEMLGSGVVLSDDQTYKREIGLGSARIEGWRESKSYRLLKKKIHTGNESFLDFDVAHQINRLRLSKKMSEIEVEAIYEVMLGRIQSYEQIIEALACLPPYLGGLLPLGFGLFHPSKRIRGLAVDLIRRFEAHQVGQKFFQGLNTFHKLAYQRLAHDHFTISLSQDKSHRSSISFNPQQFQHINTNEIPRNDQSSELDFLSEFK
ncbi:hypothetical protein O181_071742 [Austropuccinia psidii MF-1]|uniref:UDENN domain-containing protein n=1 Tax=Austropuccinia psidii MF-1 TaxID=1389203 RepID=A0A9Q3F5R3_9BASI|nr:hypothetical protein [Austropuccinia psidii MF-1]